MAGNAPRTDLKIDSNLTPEERRAALPSMVKGLEFAMDQLRGSERTDRLEFALSVLRAFEADPCGVSLEKEFCMTVHGGLQPHEARRKAERNALLVELVYSQGDLRAMPVQKQAETICQKAKLYEQGAWRADRLRDISPPSEPWATFFRIFKIGAKIPGQKRLADILKKEIQ